MGVVDALEVIDVDGEHTEGVVRLARVEHFLGHHHRQEFSIEQTRQDITASLQIVGLLEQAVEQELDRARLLADLMQLAQASGGIVQRGDGLELFIDLRDVLEDARALRRALEGMGSLVAEPQAELGAGQLRQRAGEVADGQVEHQLVLPVQQCRALALLLDTDVLRHGEQPIGFLGSRVAVMGLGMRVGRQT